MSKNRFVICDLGDIGCLYQCPDCKHVWFNTGSIHPVYCPECKPKLDRVGEQQKRMQGILLCINKEKLQRPVTFLQKKDHLNLVNWNYVSTEEITKIYKILMELE